MEFGGSDLQLHNSFTAVTQYPAASRTGPVAWTSLALVDSDTVRARFADKSPIAMPPWDFFKEAYGA